MAGVLELATSGDVASFKTSVIRFRELGEIEDSLFLGFSDTAKSRNYWSQFSYAMRSVKVETSYTGQGRPQAYAN